MIPGSPFSAKEDEYLRAHYADTETNALAAKLGRTLSSTQSRLRHLGLRKRDTDRPTTTRVTILFEDELMPRIRAGAEEAELSMSAYVQELVKAGLPKKKRSAA